MSMSFPADTALMPEAPAAEAARLLASRRTGEVPVRDRSGRIVGVVSDHDIVRVVASRALGLRGLAVEEVMSRAGA
jgi:CBS domain-containing protein